jgi:hypothetical protein
MRLVDTEYAIKLRSDEYYTDLMPIVEKFLEDDEKLVSNNVFFRKTYAFHPSDHLYIGKTKHLISALGKCLKECETVEPTSFFGYDQLNSELTPEQHFCLNWILTKDPKIELRDKNAGDIMRKHVDVVPVEKLGFFCVGMHGTYFFDPGFFRAECDIKDMKEL